MKFSDISVCVLNMECPPIIEDMSADLAHKACASLAQLGYGFRKAQKKRVVVVGSWLCCHDRGFLCGWVVPLARDRGARLREGSVDKGSEKSSGVAWAASA